jgi:hypothetical protein
VGLGRWTRVLRRPWSLAADSRATNTAMAADIVANAQVRDET